MIRGAVRVATLGYALPGSVLAVGIMVSFIWLDRQWLTPAFESLGFGAGPWLAGSMLALLLAYGVRFLAVAYGPVDSSFERIKPSLWQAARSLGASNREILWRVSIPLLRGGLFSAGLLVFVEVMKEMPATLLLRPFGWDTLATRIFEMTSEGEWERAALPAVTLVLVGLIPVILLVRRTANPADAAVSVQVGLWRDRLTRHLIQAGQAAIPYMRDHWRQADGRAIVPPSTQTRGRGLTSR